MTEPGPLPEYIGPYRVVDRLGRGGMGEVLRAHDDRLDRPVALKRVHPDARDPEKARQRFHREARAAARLSHPAIVQVHDWVESDGQDWLVMELVEGRTLEELITEGPLPPARAVTIGREVAAGLAAAHEAGLVHRDLKAANVIVTATEVKILDFGLAKLVESGPAAKAELKTTLTGEGQVVGTVSAMSPEQALGRPVDHRSDLFSLGTLLYEMLSGVLPFEGDTPVETLTRICTMKETPLRRLDSEAPEGLCRLVEHLLEKEPARRPSSARQVVVELDRMAGVIPADSPAGVHPPESRAFEVTLVEQTPGVTDPGAFQAGGKYGRWRWLFAAAGVLVLAGLWELPSWWGPPDEETPDAEVEAKLSSHELYERGMACLERYDRKGNIDKAIADFHRSLAQDESYAPALAGLACAYRLDYFRGSQDPQRLKQALAAAERAVEAGEHLAVAWVSLGMVYSEMGRFEDAARALERALQIEPLNGDAWSGLGKVFEAQGDLPQAEEHYLRAVTAQPDNWLYHSNVGVFYYQTTRYEEAEAAFLRQLELTPDSFIAFRNLGATYYMEGRLAEAATQFQQSLRIQPDSTTYSNLGTIYFAQGLYAQSVSALEKAIESGGSNDFLQWGNLGDAYRWTPDNEPRARKAYRHAIRLLNEKLDGRPQDTYLRTLRLLYLAKLGECKQALAGITSVGNVPDDDGIAWFQIAVANEVCDHRGDALAALEAALQAGFPMEEVKRDPELLNLRQDVRYHGLSMELDG